MPFLGKSGQIIQIDIKYFCQFHEGLYSDPCFSGFIIGIGALTYKQTACNFLLSQLFFFPQCLHSYFIIHKKVSFLHNSNTIIEKGGGFGYGTKLKGLLFRWEAQLLVGDAAYVIHVDVIIFCQPNKTIYRYADNSRFVVRIGALAYVKVSCNLCLVVSVDFSEVFNSCLLYTSGKIANVEVEHFERVEGVSGYNFKKLLKLWSNFTNFTVLPLRIAGIFGAVCSLLGFIYAVYIVIRKIITPQMLAGYASLVCMILIFFGITLICVGVIGEYVGRIFMCINNAPQFVIKNTINVVDNEED